MAGTTFERSPRPMSSPFARIGRIAAKSLLGLGFAGAAWLLSSSAAHADDGRDDAGPATGVLTGLVGTFGGEARAGEVLDAPGTLLTRREPTRQPTRNDLLTRVLPPSSTTAVSRGTGVDRTMTSRTTVPRTVRPVKKTTGKPRKKVSGGPDISIATTRRVKLTPPVGVPAGIDRTAGTPAVDGTSVTARGGTSTGTDGGHAARRPDRRQHAAGDGHRATTAPPPVSDRVDPSGTRHVPQFPRPAPKPVLPAVGAGNGAPSTSSGPHQDGGLTAIVPAASTISTMVEHRPVAAADVEVRQLVADSPTVSPD